MTWICNAMFRLSFTGNSNIAKEGDMNLMIKQVISLLFTFLNKIQKNPTVRSKSFNSSNGIVKQYASFIRST